MSEMSTPRTDAEEAKVDLECNERLVPSAFARQLEQELTLEILANERGMKLQAELKEMMKDLKKKNAKLKSDYNDAFESAKLWRELYESVCKDCKLEAEVEGLRNELATLKGKNP